MPDRIFVDTSFVIAWINEKDQYHNQARVRHLSSKQFAILMAARPTDALQVSAVFRYYQRSGNGSFALHSKSCSLKFFTSRRLKDG